MGHLTDGNIIHVISFPIHNAFTEIPNSTRFFFCVLFASQIINHVINDEPIRPSEINPDSKCVEHIILKCLCKRKEGRYESVEELLRVLEEYKPGSRTSYAIEEKGNAETLHLS